MKTFDLELNEPSKNICKKIDKTRIKAYKRKSSLLGKQKRKATKKAAEDRRLAAEAKEGKRYEAGGF